MTYTSNIPVTGDTLGGTRDRIRTNFQEIASVVAVNHVAFNSLGEGKHKYLQMPEVTASGAGVPTTAADEGGLYVDADSGSSPTSALFFRKESDGDSIQLTGWGGVTPVILTGTFNVTSSFTAITPALPQNVYGFIIFYKTTSPFVSQMGTFFTDSSRAYGYSHRVVRNSSSDDDAVELQNNPAADLKLYGTRDDFGSITVGWRLHYWAL